MENNFVRSSSWIWMIALLFVIFASVYLNDPHHQPRRLSSTGLIRSVMKPRSTRRWLSDHYPGGLVPSIGEVVKLSGYTSAVDLDKCMPYFVAERLDPSTVEAVVKRGNRGSFKRSPPGLDLDDTDKNHQSLYKQSGFVRGHLAAAMNHRLSYDRLMETFYMATNIVPQHPGLNTGSWLGLERQIHKWARLGNIVYIVSGPLWKNTPLSTLKTKSKKPSRTRNDRLRKDRHDNESHSQEATEAPSHLFKMVRVETNNGKLYSGKFIFENSDIKECNISKFLESNDDQTIQEFFDCDFGAIFHKTDSIDFNQLPFK